MIIVKLMGGLGNQLFQYALGRHLLEINGGELKFDISSYETDELRDYELHSYNIKEEIATAEEIKRLKIRPRKGLFRMINRIFWEKTIYLQEKHKRYYCFDPEVLSTSADMYVEGYWQNENYFLPIRDILLKEFTLKKALDKENKKILELIESNESISIHIRRGDYVTNPRLEGIFKKHGIDYFIKCIEYMAERIKKPNFFVFSNDIEWARKNLKFNYPIEFIDHNGEDKSCEEMRLLSSCSHHIIANSTFSWWGAWLGENPDKIVLTPEQWILKDKYFKGGIIVNDWIRM
jgi:hypothetical protein